MSTESLLPYERFGEHGREWFSEQEESFSVESIPCESSAQSVFSDLYDLEHVDERNSMLMWGARSAFIEEKPARVERASPLSTSAILAPELYVRAEISSNLSVRFDWMCFVTQFLLAWLLLPLYALRLLAREHKRVRSVAPLARTSSAWHKCTMILASTLYWLALLMLLVWSRLGASRAEAFFALLLHTACCATEAAIRSVRVEASVHTGELHARTEQLFVNVGREPKRKTLAMILNDRLVFAKDRAYALHGIACGAAVAYASIAWITRSYVGLGAVPVFASIIGVLVNATLALISLNVLLDCMEVLRDRMLDAAWLRTLLSHTHSNPREYLSITDWDNLMGWLTLRAFLASRRGIGRVNVEIVLCATFLVFIPLWIGVALEVLLNGEQFSEYVAMTTALCILLGAFLLGTVWHAARMQRLYRDADAFTLAKIELRGRIVRGEVEESTHTASLIATYDDLSRLFTRAQEEGTLLRIFGIPLNEKVVGLLLGMIASSLSTAIGRVLSH